MLSSMSSQRLFVSVVLFSRSWCAVRDAMDAYEIIAGERRWRAAQRAGLHEVPIVLLDVDDAETLGLAIIENVQRTDLNPLEEAAGYQRLADENGHSQDEIAKIIGKSRSYVANTLRLLRLSDQVKGYICSGKLPSDTHACWSASRTRKSLRKRSSKADSPCARSRRSRRNARAMRAGKPRPHACA